MSYSTGDHCTNKNIHYLFYIISEYTPFQDSVLKKHSLANLLVNPALLLRIGIQ